MAHYAADKEHPLRYACDRCHAHKLRCNRVDQSESASLGAAKSCSRCLKARTPCVIGLRGKVGRPAKSTKRKNDAFDAAGPTPYHEGLPPPPPPPGQGRAAKRNSIVVAPLEPDAGLFASAPSAVAGALPSHAAADEGVDAHLYTGLPSPSQYLAADVQPFPFSPGEMESWEALGLLPYEFKPPFSPAFTFGPSAPHEGEPFSQEPSLATSDSTVGDDGDALESDVETATIRSAEYASPMRLGSRAAEPRGLGSRAGPLAAASAMPNAPKLPTPASTSSPAGTQSLHERLCELSLRIGTAASGLAEHGAGVGDVALKDVSSLAGELIDAARQIVPQLPPAPSPAPPSGSEPAAEARGPPLPLAGLPAASEAGLIFLLLACYAGLLSALERVLDGLWAQHEDHGAGRGAASLSSRLESSLAAHAVHYLFTLLRDALCLRRPGEGGAAAADEAGRPSPPSLLTATCADIRSREEDIQKRAEKLQQALIR